MNESEDLIPQGAIIFQDDGTIELHLAEGITEEDKGAIVLASDFALVPHAFSIGFSNVSHELSGKITF